MDKNEEKEEFDDYLVGSFFVRFYRAFVIKVKFHYRRLMSKLRKFKMETKNQSPK